MYYIFIYVHTSIYVYVYYILELHSYVCMCLCIYMYILYICTHIMFLRGKRSFLSLVKDTVYILGFEISN